MHVFEMIHDKKAKMVLGLMKEETTKRRFKAYQLEQKTEITKQCAA